jgi:hypothetical protein
MRFGFATPDHRVPLSVARYAAPPIEFEYLETRDNLVPIGAIYSAAHTQTVGGSEYLLEVDEGGNYQWIKGADDTSITNADHQSTIFSGGVITPAQAFEVRAKATQSEMDSWGGTLPALIPTLDGVTFEPNDFFLIQNFSDDSKNGIYQVTSEAGAYSEYLAGTVPSGSGMTVKVTEGTTNADGYYWYDSDDSQPTAKIWRSGTQGKVYLRLKGTPGILVTAVVRRVIL